MRIGVCLLILGIAGASVRGQTAPIVSEPPVVIAAGEGIVRVAPSLAFLTIATETRARNPKDAQRENAETMSAVQQKLRAAGVPGDAIRTIAYTVELDAEFVNGRRVPRGYVVRNAIEVRVEDLLRVGELIDATVSAGATSVQDIRYDLKNREAVERQALNKAVEDARARAEAAASGAGRSIDRVIRIEDQRAAGFVPRPIPMPMMSATRAEHMEVTPVSTGQIEIRANVILTAALK